MAGTKRAARLACSRTHSHGHHRNQRSRGSSRAIDVRDGHCRRCRVGGSTVDGAGWRRGVRAAVLDQPIPLALSFRGQTLHSRYPVRLASPGARSLGDRTGPLIGPGATYLALVDGRCRRSLVCERRAAGDSCLRGLPVCRRVAPRRAACCSLVRSRWAHVARVVRPALSDFDTPHVEQPVPAIDVDHRIASAIIGTGRHDEVVPRSARAAGFQSWRHHPLDPALGVWQSPAWHSAPGVLWASSSPAYPCPHSPLLRSFHCTSDFRFG